MPAPHHSVFTGRMPFLPPNQQHQSTECNICPWILMSDGWMQEPEMLIDWYNGIIKWLAEVASHDSLQLLSWPVPEFSGTCYLLLILYCLCCSYFESHFCFLHVLLFTVSLSVLSSVLWRYWFGGRKGIRSVKNWVVGCWRGYLSGARCRLACGPADATATHCLLLH